MNPRASYIAMASLGTVCAVLVAWLVVLYWTRAGSGSRTSPVDPDTEADRANDEPGPPPLDCTSLSVDTYVLGQLVQRRAALAREVESATTEAALARLDEDIAAYRAALACDERSEGWTPPAPDALAEGGVSPYENTW